MVERKTLGMHSKCICAWANLNEKQVFSYSRMTCNICGVALTFTCQDGATGLQFCSSSQLSLAQLAQLGQGGWASCCEHARLKN